MRFLTRRVILIAIIISFVPCFFCVLPVLIFGTHDDPVMSLLAALLLSVVMFVMGLGVTYADSLRDTGKK